MLNLQQSLDLVYQSYLRAGQQLRGTDDQTRHPAVSGELFARLGLALNSFPVVLVTGSKGKGSTALFTAAMLQGMGYRVGLVTSPHLVDFRERIRMDGQAIPAGDFVRIMNAHAEVINQLDSELPTGQYIGPNGIIFACAMRYFLEQGVEAAVIEAGRGGRFDEASLFAATAVCLTPMMDEHLDKLGPTIREVAWHKAGLISPGCTVACAQQPPEVLAVIEQIAAERGARVVIQARGQGDFYFKLRSNAPFQRDNAALARVAAEAVAQSQGRSREGITRLLPDLRLPGRCEQIANQPGVWIDGAINRIAAEQFLAGALAERSEPTVLITALPADKDYKGVLETLGPYLAHIIVTEADNPHLHFTAAVEELAQRLHPHVTVMPQSSTAFPKGLQLVGEGGTLWAVGTQSLVRDALRYWEQSLETLWV
jgi:dihydrofolate synthase / folylpolyglutamate synthase